MGLDKLKPAASDETKAKSNRQLVKGKEKSDYDPNDPKNSQWLSMKLVSSLRAYLPIYSQRSRVIMVLIAQKSLWSVKFKSSVSIPEYM